MLTSFYGLFFREQVFKLKIVILSAKLMHFQASPCASTHLLDDQDNLHKTKIYWLCGASAHGPSAPLLDVLHTTLDACSGVTWALLCRSSDGLGASTTQSSRFLRSTGEGGQAREEPGLPAAQPGVKRSCLSKGH